MFDLPDTAILYADSARGVYIPQHFAESIKRECVTGVSEENWNLLTLDPNDENTPEHYWDVWNDVEQNARVTCPDTGIVYTLYHDGDLWLVPENWNPED